LLVEPIGQSAGATDEEASAVPATTWIESNGTPSASERVYTKIARDYPILLVLDDPFALAESERRTCTRISDAPDGA
jgi:hypothetical protein